MIANMLETHMKTRLVVMNGQCLVQIEQSGEWSTEKVDKASTVKPGIYNIYLAAAVDKAKPQVGVIIYADEGYIYQQVGKNFVKHQLADFERVPALGASLNVKYEGDRAVVTLASQKLGRRI